MLRFLTISVVLVVVGPNVNAFAQNNNTQNNNDLARENQSLRERIEELEQQLANAHHHHDEHGHDDEHHTMEETQHDHHASGGKDHCEPHFDFCLPYEEHHGGHGHCDLCGCAATHSGDDGEHDHGHAHGPAYHHSIEGYPILHSPRTEFFFVERHAHFRLVDVQGADDGTVDELEFEAEIVYALNDRLVLIGTLPVIHLDPDGAPSTSGVGDMEFGVRMMAFNGERDGVLFGLDAVVPTGDEDRDLGGETLLLTSANWVHDFGCGTYMFNVVTWQLPIDDPQPENVFLHDFVVAHTFLNTSDAPLFRYLTPSLEFNTEAILNGPESGRTVVDATFGLNWIVGEGNEVSIGWSFPITGDENFENQALFNFIRHL